MLYRWIPAAFPTPTRWQCRQKKWVTKCVVLPHLMDRDGSPEEERKFRKLCEIPSAKTLYPEKWSLSFAFALFPFGKAHVCCGSWRTHSHTHPVWFFCLPIPRTGRCVPSLALALSGTTFRKVSLSCFLIRHVFSISLNCIPKYVWSHPCLKMLLSCHSYKPPYYRNRDIVLFIVALKVKSIPSLYYPLVLLMLGSLGCSCYSGQ